MSAYDNVMGGKLKLKGKALDLKADGMKKKKKKKMKKMKKKQMKQFEQISKAVESENAEQLSKLTGQENREVDDKTNGEENSTNWDNNLTPAERRYMEQREKINSHKLGKTSNKSHRDRIEDFNQYLANMSEHYDIPKVGPG